MSRRASKTNAGGQFGTWVAFAMVIHVAAYLILRPIDLPASRTELRTPDLGVNVDIEFDTPRDIQIEQKPLHPSVSSLGLSENKEATRRGGRHLPVFTTAQSIAAVEDATPRLLGSRVHSGNSGVTADSPATSPRILTVRPGSGGDGPPRTMNSDGDRISNMRVDAIARCARASGGTVTVQIPGGRTCMFNAIRGGWVNCVGDAAAQANHALARICK